MSESDLVITLTIVVGLIHAIGSALALVLCVAASRGDAQLRDNWRQTLAERYRQKPRNGKVRFESETEA